MASAAPMIKWRRPHTEGRRVSARGGHSGVVVGTDLIFFGGTCYGGSGKFEYYDDTAVLDLETNTWYPVKTGGRSPPARYGHACEVVGTRVYVFGGKGPSGALYGDVFCLDTATWQWNEVSSTTAGPGARFGHATTVVGDKVVVHGGWDGRRCFADLWIFDTAAQAWIEPRVSGRAPQARHGHGMELTFDGRILVFAGCALPSKACPQSLSDVWSLDIATMVWTRPCVSGDVVDPRYAMSTCMLGKYLVSFGGYVQRRDKTVDQARGGDGVTQKVKKPIQTYRIVALDTEELKWVQPSYFGHCFDDLYGESIAMAGSQVILYGGWGGNRALDELFVGEPLGDFAASIALQQSEADPEPDPNADPDADDCCDAEAKT